MTCKNNNHTFNNGRHNPICTVEELANHIATVRILVTTFNDHLNEKYSTFVNGTFGFFLTGFENGLFVSECLSMLEELRSLVKLRVDKYCCSYDEDRYKSIIKLIDIYKDALDNIKDYNESDVKLILKDLIDNMLKFYDISLIDSDEDDSDYYESEPDSDSITLSDEDDSVYCDTENEESNK